MGINVTLLTQDEEETAMRMYSNLQSIIGKDKAVEIVNTTYNPLYEERLELHSLRKMIQFMPDCHNEGCEHQVKELF